MKIALFAILTLLTFTACQAQQVEKSLVEDLREKVVDKTYPKIDAIVVKHDNEIIIEEYFNEFEKDSQHDMRSSFKSITILLDNDSIFAFVIG